MIAKALEIRDEGTFIAALAVDLNPVAFVPETAVADCELAMLRAQHEAQRYLLRRCDYACDGRPNIILTRLDGYGEASNDPYAWGGRTGPAAHRYIIEHWAELKDGDVVDVEFILGETPAPKKSERETAPL